MTVRFLLSVPLVAAAAVIALLPVHAEEANQVAQTCTAAAKPMARLELIFGLSSKKGPVTPAPGRAF